MEKKYKYYNLFRNRKFKITTLVFIDLILIYLSYFLAFIFRFYYNDGLKEIISIYNGHISRITIFAFIYIIVFYLFKQYKNIWTLAGNKEFFNGIIATLLSMILNIGLSSLRYDRVPYMVSILAGIMAIITCNGARVLWRVLRRALKYGEVQKMRDIKNVLIILNIVSTPI